jgi:hypothetical protein
MKPINPQKMKPVLVVLCFLILSACSENNGNENSNGNGADSLSVANAKDSASGEYFPVLDFIKSEIRAVDSLPVGIKVYRTEGEIKDSGYLKPEEFHQLTDEFLAPELEMDQFKKTYTESSFYDRSTKTSTFHYETKKEDATIRRIDVITSATDTYDKVTSMYFEKLAGPDRFLKKLFWKPGQEFSLIEKNKVTRVVWQY